MPPASLNLEIAASTIHLMLILERVYDIICLDEDWIPFLAGTSLTITTSVCVSYTYFICIYSFVLWGI